MSLTANFTASQSLADNNIITLVDTSTGSDGTLTARRVYIQLSDGTYLKQTGITTDYSVWAYASSSIELDVLSRSQAASITVQWLNGTTVVYTKTISYIFTAADDVFYLGLAQDLAASPSIVEDKTFYSNLIQFSVNIDAAKNAISIAGDISAAQSLLDRNYNLILNEAKYF